MDNCLLCGGHRKRPPTPTHKSSYVVKNRTNGATAAKRKRTPNNIADAVIVYMLGVVKAPNGSQEVQLDSYSSINGFRIRTIPGNRWSNPQYIGAGAGYLAVVDRFADYDIVRITDEFGGATSAGFDAFGRPLQTINWPNLSDFNYFQSPKGTQVTGVGIMPNGVLVAGLSGPSFSVSIGDIPGTNGAPYTGTVDFSGSPVAAGLGQAVGNFTYFTNKQGVAANLAIGMFWDATTGGGVVVFDYILGQIKGLLGLGNTLRPSCVYESRGVVSVLMCDPVSGDAVQIVRFTAQDPTTYVMSGVTSGVITPVESSYSINQTFQQYDLPTVPVTNTPQLSTYRTLAKTLNAYPAPSSAAPVAGDGVATSTGIKPLFSTISPSLDSITANDGRTQIAGTISTTQYNGSPVDIPVGIIAVGPNSGLIAFNGYGGTIAEIYQKLNGNAIDPTQIIFRCLHAVSYDWLSTGGFSYSSEESSPTINLSSSNASPSVYTNGFYPISVAADLSGELGVIAPLPDLKVALVDAQTGLIIYNSPKPMGYNYYGGSYASVAPYNPNDIVESTFGTTADTLATGVDGITRPGLLGEILVPETLLSPPIYVTAYSNSIDCNRPWTYFVRQETGKTSPIVRLTSKSWTTQDTQDEISGVVEVLLPQWKNLNRLLTVTSTNNFFYPGPANQEDLPNAVPTIPALTCTDAGSGYFSLDLPREQTTICAQYATEIGDLSAQLGQQESVLTALQSSGTQAQKAAQQALINATQTELTNYQTLASTCDPSDPNNITFATPESILNANYGVNSSPAQIIDPILGVITEDNVTLPIATASNLTPWQTIAVPSSNPAVDDVNGDQRAIVIQPNIRSWVAVEVMLDAWSAAYTANGCSNWNTPEAQRGMLGVLLGSLIDTPVPGASTGGAYPEPPCNSIPGFLYESGLAANTANPVWEVEVLFNGNSPNLIATLVTSQAQIDGQAPGDLQPILDSLFQANAQGFNDVDPEVGQHTAQIYYSDVAIETIQITVRLLNVANDVFRPGWQTTSYTDGNTYPDGTWSGGYRAPAVYAPNPGGPVTFTYGLDPGFYWGNNCEAFCFGNIPCYGFLFAGYQLCQDDPPCAVLTNVVWEGTATYTVPSVNPYTEESIAVGAFLYPKFQFELNGGLFQYAVDLSAGTPGPGSQIPSGACNGTGNWYTSNGGA